MAPAEMWFLATYTPPSLAYKTKTRITKGAYFLYLKYNNMFISQWKRLIAITNSLETRKRCFFSIPYNGGLKKCYSSTLSQSKLSRCVIYKCQLINHNKRWVCRFALRKKTSPISIHIANTVKDKEVQIIISIVGGSGTSTSVRTWVYTKNKISMSLKITTNMIVGIFEGICKYHRWNTYSWWVYKKITDTYTHIPSLTLYLQVLLFKQLK